MLLYRVRIGLKQQNYGIYHPAHAEKSAGEHIDQAHDYSALIELVNTEFAEEKAQKERQPFVLHLHAVYIYGVSAVDIISAVDIVGVVVVYNHRLRCGLLIYLLRGVERSSAGAAKHTLGVV